MVQMADPVALPLCPDTNLVFGAPQIGFADTVLSRKPVRKVLKARQVIAWGKPQVSAPTRLPRPVRAEQSKLQISHNPIQSHAYRSSNGFPFFS